MKCESCGQDFESAPGQDKCPHCGATAESRPIRDGTSFTEGLRPPLSERPEIPKGLWEGEGPFFSRLFNTWVQAMFYPTRFFKSLPVTAGIGRPFVYALVIGSIGGLCALLWQFVMIAMQIPFMSKMSTFMPPGETGIGPGEAAIPAFFTMAMLPLFLVLVPIGVVIGQFIWSGILHLCLIILGGNKKGFGATFRVMAYGNWSPTIFQIIPFCGVLVALVWGIVLQIIGLRETHQISTGKAVLAYFLPLICCCVCSIVFFVVVVGMGASAGS